MFTRSSFLEARTAKYVIVLDINQYFVILKNGEQLKKCDGTIRTFKTRASARKRISRERNGNFR